MEDNNNPLGDCTASLPDSVDPVTSDLSLPPSKRLPADFGDYQFIERMGHGSFGEVFKVWSLSKCRYEAMKLLHDTSHTHAAQFDSFRREVQRMAEVHGANVAHVYHVGAIPSGQPFFTMEFLSGGRLDHYCDQKQVSIEDRICAVAKICETVGSMHELALIHCDIKPGNIVVTEESGAMIPKLVDFGIASHLAFKQSPQKAARGTLFYMPPEQMESRGGAPEKSWDIYALGVTLYELIVGVRPIEAFPDQFLPLEVHADFLRKTPIPPLAEKLTSSSKKRFEQIAMERHLGIEALRDRLRDPWLQAVVEKALSKDKGDRYASAGEMALNLRQYLAGRRPSIVPPTLRNRAGDFFRDYRLALTGLAVLAVVGTLLLWGNLARRDARKASADWLFAEGRSELEPMLAIERYQKALELNPMRSDILLHMAGAYVTSGDAEKAGQIAASISESDKDYANAQALICGIKQFRPSPEGDHVSVIEQPIDIPPGTEYYYSLTLRPTEAQFAISLLDKALEHSAPTHEDQFRIRLMRAMRYFQLQDFDSMEKEAQWLVDTVPKSAVAHNLRGIAYLKKGGRFHALAAFDQAIRVNPDYAAAYQNRASVGYELRKCSNALNDCIRAVTLSPAVEPFVQSIRINALRCLGGKDELSKAKTECDSARATHEPVTSQTHIACGNLWETLGLPDQELDEFDRAARQMEQEGSMDVQLVYIAFLSRGGAALGVERYADALADLNRAAEIDPKTWQDDPRNFALRGVAYFLTDKSGSAVADWKEAAQRTKDLPQRSRIYLWIWDAELSRGRITEAADALHQASSAAKDDARSAKIVAYCAGAKDRESLLKDAGNDPAQQVEAYYPIGLAAKARGDFPEAQDWFRNCVALNVGDHAEYYLAKKQLTLPWNHQ